MSRNLCDNCCPRCKKPFSIDNALGKPLESKKYGFEEPVYGVKIRCECGIDLFVWINGPYDWPSYGCIDLSYYHTFDDECYPGKGGYCKDYTTCDDCPGGIYK
jgi:hypothetical protein